MSFESICSKGGCPCKIYAPPVTFGTSCSVCGHQKAAHTPHEYPYSPKATGGNFSATSSTLRSSSSSLGGSAAFSGTGTGLRVSPSKAAAAATSIASRPATPHSKSATATSTTSPAATSPLKSTRSVAVGTVGQTVSPVSKHTAAAAVGASPSPSKSRVVKEEREVSGDDVRIRTGVSYRNPYEPPTVEVISRKDGNLTVRFPYPDGCITSPSSHPAYHPHPRGGATTHDHMAMGSLVREAELIAMAGDVAKERGDKATAEKYYAKAAGIYGELNTTKSVPALQKSVRYADERLSSPQSSARSVSSVESDVMTASAVLPRPLKGESPVDQMKADQELMDLAEWSDSARTVVKQLFMQHSQQQPQISFDAFKSLLSDVGLTDHQYAFFRSFDRSGHKSWLSIADFMMGIVALDPLTPHAGHWRTERARYIFRFYSATGRHLSWDEFTNLVEDAAPDNAKVKPDKLHKRGTDMDERTFVGLIINNALDLSLLFRWSLLEAICGEGTMKRTSTKKLAASSATMDKSGSLKKSLSLSGGSRRGY